MAMKCLTMFCITKLLPPLKLRLCEGTEMSVLLFTTFLEDNYYKYYF